MLFYMTGGLAKREFNEIITAAWSRPPYDWNGRQREKIGPRFGSRRTITSVFLTDAQDRTRYLRGDAKHVRGIGASDHDRSTSTSS